MRQRKTPEETCTDRAVRERLLDEALHLFSLKGYTATTVREIVEAAGVSKPVLYYYFQNKEGIFRELMLDASRRFEALLAEARQEQGTVRERIVRLAEKVYDLFLKRIEIARLGLAVQHGPFPGKPVFDLESFHRKFRQEIYRLVREGVRKREFQKQSATDITWVILAVVNMAVEIRLWHPREAVGGKGLLRLLNVIFVGLSRNEGKEKGKTS